MMKFTCTQENLVKGLSRTAAITGRNTQLPVLQNIMLNVREGGLALTATDLEVGVHTIVGGKVEE
ncbi:MAG: DNA polymerase III subunit beta, partial [Acidobacteriota bacterium]